MCTYVSMLWYLYTDVCMENIYERKEERKRDYRIGQGGIRRNIFFPIGGIVALSFLAFVLF